MLWLIILCITAPRLMLSIHAKANYAIITALRLMLCLVMLWLIILCITAPRLGVSSHAKTNYTICNYSETYATSVHAKLIILCITALNAVSGVAMLRLIIPCMTASSLAPYIAESNVISCLA